MEFIDLFYRRKCKIRKSNPNLVKSFFTLKIRGKKGPALSVLIIINNRSIDTKRISDTIEFNLKSTVEFWNAVKRFICSKTANKSGVTFRVFEHIFGIKRQKPIRKKQPHIENYYIDRTKSKY